MHPIIIIGTGLAGYTLAKEIRKIDSEIPLLMISKDQGHFYSKPLLSTAFSYKRGIPELYTADAETMAKQLNAKILTQTSITRIDPIQKQVITDQEAFSYSHLVLALGADVIRVPFSGNAVDELLSVNDLEDYAAFRESLQKISQEKKRIAILGAGLVGCEFANDLIHSGHHIDIIALSSYPADRLLPKPIGMALQQALTEAGVCWHLEKEITRIDKEKDVYHVTLSNQDVLETDLVFSAIGLNPRLELAKMAGLETARGIIVNAQLQTSDPHIYALGDCAEVNGLVLLFVAPILQCSKALAKTLTGESTGVKYPAMPISLKTPACPIVVCPPKQNIPGEWRLEGKYPNLKALFMDENNSMQGFALSGQAVKERLTLTQALPPLFE